MKRPYSVAPILIFIVFASCLWLGCNQDVSKNDKSRSFRLKTEFPESSAIKLINNGTNTSRFVLSINKYTFFDIKSMISAISEIYPANTSREVAAWRFVKDYTYFEEPLTDKNWIHSPEILINSLGFGYCDDKASALSYLWESMGCFSRVWNLSGHVVPEVFIDSTWKMYDPDYEVYYLNKDSTVAAVNDLMHDPYLVRFGFRYKLPCTNIHSLWNRFSLKTARVYSTKDDNNISEWYSEFLEEYQLTITLPANATFEFPGKYEPYLVNFIGDTITTYANARLCIPIGFSGKISIPLVAHTFKGKGTIMINDIEYAIGSKEITDLINSREFFLREFHLSNISSPVQIIYLINPMLTLLTRDNSVELEGSNLSDISALIYELAETETVSMPAQFSFPEEIYNIEPYMRRLSKYSEVRIENKIDVYKKLILLITSNSDLSSVEMTSQYELFSKKIESVLTRVNTGINLNEFYKAFNDDSYFAVFISLVEHISEEELIDVINNSGNLKKHGKLHQPDQ